MELLLEVWGQVGKEKPSGLQSIVLDSWVTILKPRNTHSCDVFNIGQKWFFTSLGDLTQENESHALLFPVSTLNSSFYKGAGAR